MEDNFGPNFTLENEIDVSRDLATPPIRVPYINKCILYFKEYIFLILVLLGLNLSCTSA